MTNKLIDHDNCHRAFETLLRQGRALVLVRSTAALRDAFEDLLRTAEDLRVPVHTDWAGGKVKVTIAAGVPKDHAGIIEILNRRDDGANLRGMSAHLVLHPFNVAPSEVYPVIAVTGGDVHRYAVEDPARPSAVPDRAPIIINMEPQHGMTSSAAVALSASLRAAGHPYRF